jgi:hypothetical protein
MSLELKQSPGRRGLWRCQHLGSYLTPSPTSQKPSADASPTVSTTGSVLAWSRRATWPAFLRFPFRIAADMRRPPPLVTRCGKGPDPCSGSPEIHTLSDIARGRASS